MADLPPNWRGAQECETAARITYIDKFLHVYIHDLSDRRKQRSLKQGSFLYVEYTYENPVWQPYLRKNDELIQRKGIVIASMFLKRPEFAEILYHHA